MFSFLKKASAGGRLAERYASYNSMAAYIFKSVEPILRDPIFVGHLYGLCQGELTRTLGREPTVADMFQTFVPATTKSYGGRKTDMDALFKAVVPTDDFKRGTRGGLLFDLVSANPDGAMRSVPDYERAAMRVDGRGPDFLAGLQAAGVVTTVRGAYLYEYADGLLWKPLRRRHDDLVVQKWMDD